eukprot:m.198693 g.198693  ORF g.198693 m.198693 type:complete len:98 (+) comp18757_c1_seq1:370-663(+)
MNIFERGTPPASPPIFRGGLVGFVLGQTSSSELLPPADNRVGTGNGVVAFENVDGMQVQSFLECNALANCRNGTVFDVDCGSTGRCIQRVNILCVAR